MPVLVPLAMRLLLAGVFGLAGLAKLTNLRAAALSLVPFGIPERNASLFASLLAAAELTLAAAVIPTRTALPGSVGIAALLLLFIVVIAINLQRGNTPQCHCFGQLKSEPIGSSLLVRNTVLGLLALIVAWDAAPVAAATAGVEGASRASWPAGLEVVRSASLATVIALLALVVAVGMAGLFIKLLKQYGQVLLRVERLERELGIAPAAADTVPAGLPVGSPLPALTVPSLDGSERTLAGLGGEGDTVALVFIEPGCGPCTDLLPEVAELNKQAELANRMPARSGRRSRRLQIALVTSGSVDANRAKTAPHGIERVLLQREREVAEAFGAVATPSAVLVRNGLVSSGLAVGPDAVRDLLNGALTGEGTALIGIGDEVPAIDVPDVGGRMHDLRSLTRPRTLMVFWNPTCGYCEQMLPQLREWEQRASPSDPTLLLVSQGTPSLIREQGLRATVVLDEGFVLGKSFGAQGTPSGVLVENGRVVSEVGVGAADVFALAARAALVTHG